MSHWIEFKENSATGLRSVSDGDLLVVCLRKRQNTSVLASYHCGIFLDKSNTVFMLTARFWESGLVSTNVSQHFFCCSNLLHSRNFKWLLYSCPVSLAQILFICLCHQSYTMPRTPVSDVQHFSPISHPCLPYLALVLLAFVVLGCMRAE